MGNREHNRKLVFSSKEKRYETPPALFDALDEHFHFDLDAAASDQNALCDRWLTEVEDGLNTPWIDFNTFCNPPYGIGMTGRWVQKAYDESLKDECDKVLLIPAKTETLYFDIAAKHAAEIYFIKGRLKFYRNGIEEKNAAGFPSAIVVFNRNRNGTRDIRWVDRVFQEMW